MSTIFTGRLRPQPSRGYAPPRAATLPRALSRHDFATGLAAGHVVGPLWCSGSRAGVIDHDSPARTRPISGAIPGADRGRRAFWPCFGQTRFYLVTWSASVSPPMCESSVSATCCRSRQFFGDRAHRRSPVAAHRGHDSVQTVSILGLLALRNLLSRWAAHHDV